ncbi:MlaD family protein [Patulibacter brassicae]|uniref:MlaD family protein n=1 Tax=Patulibacter brassicae TaxID=1705717 RepID=A0ABU4VQH9_9ACTN|nr:MlaD family protein [Patulibacter brassicae]MDX8153720.1 MlaD family protein [Patulibacter brassicae]
MSALRRLHDRFGLAPLGAVVMALILFVSAFYYFGWAQKVFYDKGEELRIEFSATPQLQPGDLVKVDGRDEGRVQEIEGRPDGRGSIVTVDIQEDAGPLYRDARAEVRWKHLLGGSFYVKVDRGTPSAGPLDDRFIAQDRTIKQVEVDDVTSIFDGRARQGLVTLPGELRETLRDPQVPARLFDTVATEAPSLERGLRAVRGQDPGRDLQRVLDGATRTMRALDAPNDELRRLVSGAAATLQTTAARGNDLRATLADGPATTQLVRATLARLNTTLSGADRLVDRLDDAAGDVAPTLAELRPTLGRTSGLLGDARPLVRHLRPAVSSLAQLSAGGVPLLDAIQPSIDRLEQKILPYLNEKDPETGKPTSSMIGGTAAGFGGAASQQDENGHFIRFPASAGTGSPSVHIPCQTVIVDPSVKQLLACQSLDQMLGTYLQYLPGGDSERPKDPDYPGTDPRFPESAKEGSR